VAAADAKPRCVNSKTSISACLPRTLACQMNPATSPRPARASTTVRGSLKPPWLPASDIP
jgi:hypothetical protein